MPKHVIAIAALSALLACAATAASEDSSGPEAINRPSGAGCEVRLTPTPQGLRIEALALFSSPMSGEYDLVITKDGPSGSSDVSQGGPFEALANAELTLSAAEFGLARGDHYSARLLLRNESGVLCRDERRS